MSDNKLTPEQLKQLQALQTLLANKQNANKDMGAMNMQGITGMTQSVDKETKKKFSLAVFTPKNILISILKSMQGGVKFIDQFTNFIVKKDSDKVSDVITSARSPILFGTYIIIIFVISGFLWAATAPLDSAAHAPGTVMSNSKKRELNHQDGGMIKKIYAAVGDKVKKDDPLIEFNDARIKAEHDISLGEYRALLATEDRLNSEVENLDVVNYDSDLIQYKDDPKIVKIIATQDNLLKSRLAIKQAEKDSLEQRKNQSHKQIEGIEAKKVATQKSLNFISNRLESTKKLYEKGYAQKALVLEWETKEASAISDIANADTEIAKSQQEVIRVEIELLNADSKYTAQALQELKEVQARLAQARERLTLQADMLSRIIVRSPVDGIVNNLNYHTIGMSVQPFQTLVEISPLDDNLIIEAKIDPKNIDSVHLGLTAKIKFSAFKSRTTPLFTGKVVSLSPDIITDRNADPRAQGSSYYLAKIELDMEEFQKMSKQRHLELHPGMQAEVQIVTGTRTLLRYLLDPIIDAMFKGFKEK